MRNTIIKNLLLAVTLVVGLSSCEDRDIITIETEAAPKVMDLSTSSVILDKNFPASQALTVTWDPAQMNVPVESKYNLEISKTPDFAEPVTLITKEQSQTTASFTTKELNEASKKIGLVPFKVQKMYFRVQGFLGAGSMPTYSEVTSLNITPYLASPTYEYQDLYLIGNATAGGWDNLADNGKLLPLLKTSSPSKYTFTGYFKAKSGTDDAGFKMIKVKGSWDAQYGLGAKAGELSTDGGSGNISVPADGYYKLTVDTDALTYTLEPVTVPATTYTSISIIGSVNGDWNNDTQLKQSTFDPHVWSAQGVVLKAGEFKFRANNAWDVSWGTNAEYFGVASTTGANIPLSADWTYDVYLNDATGNYTIIPVN